MSNSQTKRKAKSISVQEMPFSKKEEGILQSIIEAPHWARRKMKDVFINDYLRPSEEVDAYIGANGKRKNKQSTAIINSPEPISPKVVSDPTQDPSDILNKEVVALLGSKEVFILYRSGNEIRITGFKSFKMEGGNLIIEIE